MLNMIHDEVGQSYIGTFSVVVKQSDRTIGSIQKCRGIPNHHLMNYHKQ
jgi:hypothetical protein